MPNRSLRSSLLILSALISLLAVPSPTEATSFVMVRDRHLADQTPLIVEARAVAQLPAPLGERPMTDYQFEISRWIKGSTPGSALIVRVPGGVRPDGTGLKIWGAPSFLIGEEMLLFLRLSEDGTYRVAHLMLGAFHKTRASGHQVAVRDLSEVEQVTAPGEEPEAGSRRVREFARFADWLADRAAGLRRPADYFVVLSAQGLRSLAERYSLLTDSGKNMRWFEFDTNKSVTFRAYQSGQAGVSGGGFSQFQTALSAWNNESQTPIRYSYGGTTSASAGFSSFDGVNAILFGDLNQDIEGTYDCGGGGVLAIGGPWFDTDTTGTFNNKSYIRIQGADIVTNDGIECLFQGTANSQKNAEELFGHELGHTLGLGHSSERRGESNSTLKEALMYFQIHGDGRGAALKSDDQNGLRALYKKSSGGGGGNPNCPNADTTLCLMGARFQVTVTWENQFNGASGVGGTLPQTDLSGYFYFDDPSNVELIVKILDFGDSIKVFYGQLTNLRFTITVTDTESGRVKTYSNTAGECGGLDNNFLSGSSEAVSGASTAGGKAACVSDSDTLCLLNKRFQLEVTWRNQFDGSSGSGLAKPLTDLTGQFAFTDPSNIEILTKVLDFGDHFLFIYGSLSNLEYSITVTDTATGEVKTYSNPAGTVCGGIDENF